MTPKLSTFPVIAQDRCLNRIDMDASVRIFSGNAMWNTKLLHVSLSDVLVAMPDTWSGTPGNLYRLDLRLDSGILIGMGVEFIRAESEALAFNCVKIDLASLTQFKRLIELNIGKHDTLIREFSKIYT